MTLNANGTFSYVHDGSETFGDSFSYRVTDAVGNFSTASVSIAVTPVNDNDPSISDASFTVDEARLLPKLIWTAVPRCSPASRTLICPSTRTRCKPTSAVGRVSVS